jgi:uncharacterized membrane protein (UPF0182 family)
VRLLVALLAAFALFVVPAIARFSADWLWFGEVGYRQVFATEITTRAVVGAVAGALALVWLSANLLLALSSLTSRAPLRVRTSDGFEMALPGRDELRRLVLLGALALALIVGFVASGQWLDWLSFRHAVPFNIVDPILERDVSYYVYTLPLLQRVRMAGLALTVVAAVGAGLVYAAAGLLGLTRTGSLILGVQPRRHLSLLAAVFLLLLAWGAWLGIPSALVAPNGLIYGAGYADLEARFPAARALAAAAVLAALLAAQHAFSTRSWPLPAAGALYLLVFIGGQAYGAAIQRFVVAPNEQVRETPYIVHNIAATRRAFGLDGVEERELSGDAALTRDDIARNADTLKNVRLWDHQPLLDTFAQIQEIRTYYDFASVDNDRYLINGEYRQIMLSARELNTASLPNRSWINERLTFTHGYGLTLGPVNQVTGEGLPVLFIKDLPPQSSVDLNVDEPSIYFGELASDHVLVRTRAREFHYPKGDDNVYSTYEGTGGIGVGTFWRRLLFSVRHASLSLLLSDDISPESRILMRRNIRDRVTSIAPFVTFDADPYLVIADGRLVWLFDGYTHTGGYPYSTRSAGGISYIRNSVKVTIDAYHGTTTFYLADATDPLALTLARVFPGLFKPLDTMPDAIRRHVRYPEDIFALQTAMYATYHMTNPAVFYNKEDQWEVPIMSDSEGGGSPLQPYYAVMKLPGENRAEFIQFLPYTPRRKDNLAAWMVAQSDGTNYGRLVVFQFPKQKVVFGPRQVVARINQDQTIAPQITLWNQQGSQVIQGTLLIIPIEESLLYIRPLYLRGTTGRIPELKRVIVAYQGQIVMEETLERALDRLFGAGSLAPDRPAGAEPNGPPDGPSLPIPMQPASMPRADLADRANAHYQRALQAQRDGNWALYGEEIRRLGEVLNEMRGPSRP